MLEFSDGAVADAAEAFGWYRDRGEDLALRFQGALERTVALVTEHPTIAAPRPSGYRHAVLQVFPYALIYKYDGRTVRVYAVAHTKRMPGYWVGKGTN